jgi:hypothetical protein
MILATSSVLVSGSSALARSATLTATSAIGVAGAEPDPIGVLEDTIHAWVVAGSGLDADHVIWSAEASGGGPVPAGTYISMRLLATGTVSEDWVIARIEGGNIVSHVRGTRHPTLELTCFSGGRYGSGRAQMVLTRVLAALRLPTIAAALRAGNVGIGDRGKVRMVEGRRSTMFDPRAVVEIALHTQIDVSELGQSIETVEIDLTPPGAIVTAARPEE